jgi:hypothetical protein
MDGEKTKKIEDFLAEFRAAVNANQGPSVERRASHLALRNAQSLKKHLGRLKEQGADVTDEIVATEGIVDRLGALSRPLVDLRPLIRKGETLLELDDLLDADLLTQVEELVGEGRAALGSGRHPRSSPPLPFSVAAECTECRERIVGLRGGVIRWQRVLQIIKEHESDAHGEPLRDETVIKSLRSEFLEGADQETVGRYRIFRV